MFLLVFNRRVWKGNVENKRTMVVIVRVRQDLEGSNNLGIVSEEKVNNTFGGLKGSIIGFVICGSTKKMGSI